MLNFLKQPENKEPVPNDKVDSAYKKHRLQGMGWPPSGRAMVQWFSITERGTKMSFWNVAHNVGGGLPKIENYRNDYLPDPEEASEVKLGAKEIIQKHFSNTIFNYK